MKPPTDLKPTGKKLWRNLTKAYDINDSEELLAELCRTADRLGDVRQELATEPLVKDGKAHPLLYIEAKLAAQFRLTWKTLGLADDPEGKRPVGRPATNEGGEPWRR